MVLMRQILFTLGSHSQDISLNKWQIVALLVGREIAGLQAFLIRVIQPGGMVH